MNELIRGGGRPAGMGMTDEELVALEQCLWPEASKRHVWMIVDAARDRSIFPLLLACHLEYSCLFSGPLDPELELAAPYLVQLDFEYRDTRRLIKEAWGKSWGVFLRCDIRMERLRGHLRTLLVVRHKDERLAFRYYDPRVLRAYLPTCLPEELETVFGPAEKFWAEQGDGEMREYRFERRELVTRDWAIASR